MESLLATSSSDAESCPGSQLTSKAGLRMYESSTISYGSRDSGATSKAGGSWRESQGVESQSSNNFGGSWRSSRNGHVDSLGTSKAGGSWKENQDVDSQGTSKAGGSWRKRDEIDSQGTGTSLASGSWRTAKTGSQEPSSRNTGQSQEVESQGTSKARGSRRDSQTDSRKTGSFGTSKAGELTRHPPGLGNHLVESEAVGTAGRSRSRSKPDSHVHGSQNYSRSESSRGAGFPNSQHLDLAARGGPSSSSKENAVDDTSRLGSVGPGQRENSCDTNELESGGGKSGATSGSSMSQRRDSHAAMVPLSGRSETSCLPHRDFVYGDESRLSTFHALEQSSTANVSAPPPPLDSKQPPDSARRRGRGRGRGVGRGRGGGVGPDISKSLSNLTIDNSVNAVRAWTPATEQKQQQQLRRAEGGATPGDGDGDDSFNKFLRNSYHRDMELNYMPLIFFAVSFNTVG